MNALLRKFSRHLVPLALGLAMVGCGSEQFQDLKQFVADAETVAGTRARIDPLPKVEANLIGNPKSRGQPYRRPYKLPRPPGLFAGLP